jgi:hypothetical protein
MRTVTEKLRYVNVLLTAPVGRGGTGAIVRGGGHRVVLA